MIQQTSHIKIIPQTFLDQSGKLTRTYGVIINGVAKYVIYDNDEQ